MKPPSSNQILLILIIFFGIFILSGLLKYFGMREGMTGTDETEPVSGTSVTRAVVSNNF
jgi:uncharacterized membrane protein YphA (DoxX/SURF4 family)